MKKYMGAKFCFWNDRNTFWSGMFSFGVGDIGIYFNLFLYAKRDCQYKSMVRKQK